MEQSSPIRILHVDDEPGFAELAADRLERENGRFAVETATSASEGLERLTDDVDCIVSDYDMPGTNGIEFLEAVREDRPEVPFVLFTGKGNEAVASDAISAGVTDYMQKGQGADQYAVLANRIANSVDQYRAEREAAATQRRLEELTGSTPDCLWMFDSEWEELLFISGYEEVWDRPADAIREDPRDFLDGIHPEHRDRVRDAMERLSAGESIDIEHRIRRGNDEEGWVGVKGEPIFGDDGAVVRVVGFTRDITDRRAREERLRQTTARLEALFENSPDMINVHDTEGNIIDPNPRLCERTGYDADALADMKVWDLDRTIDPDEARSLWAEMDVGDRRELEGVYECRDGSTFPVEVHVRRLDLEGEDRFVVISRDITDRKRRERDLGIYEAVVEAIDDAVCAVDDRGQIQFVNESYAEMKGVDRSALLDTPIERWIDDEWLAAARPLIEELANGERDVATMEYDFRSADGDRIPVELRSTTLRLPDGGEGIVGVVRDVGDREEMERELREKSNLLDQIFEQVPLHFYVKDEAGRHLRISEYYEGAPDAEEAIGKTDRELYPEAGAETYADDMRVIETGEPLIDKEEYIPSSDHWNLTSKVPWYDESGEIRGLIGVTRNISDLKEYEQELERQNERLEKLVNVISHDLRNPLNVAQGRLELAREECESAALEDIARAHDRMRTLIDDLLTVARLGEPVTAAEPLDVAALVEGCWGNVDTADATVVVDVDRHVRGSERRFKQLLENLIRNAVEHGGADVTVTVGGLEDGIYVEDDGPGIPEGEREEVFEGGYSTAEGGTGFGLSIVKEIVEAHGWEIRVTEGSDGGARFEITGVEFAAAGSTGG